jgi:hypothetical protein
MTTATRTGRSTSPAPWPYAVGGAAVSLVLTAYGTFKEDNLPGDLPGWLFINVPIIVVATALVFGLVVPRVLRSEHPETPGRAALVLSLIELATVVIANFGFPAVLAAAAVCTATATRRRTGQWTGPAAVALVLSAISVSLALVLAIVG